LLTLVRPMMGHGLRTHAFRFLSERGEVARRSRAQSETVAAIARWFRGAHREHHVDAQALTAAFVTATTSDQPSTGGLLAALATTAMRAAGGRVWLAGLATPQMIGSDSTRLVSWLWHAGRHGSTSGLTRAVARLLACRRPFGRAAALAGYVGPSDAIAPAYLATRGVFGPEAMARLMRADALAHARATFDEASHVDARALTPFGPPCLLPAGSAKIAIGRAVAAVDLAGPLMSGALRDAEASAVARGLALRAPFLDHRLHEWITLGGASHDRSPLTTVLQGVLPPPLVRRLAPPPPLPMAEWLRGDLRALAERHLLADEPDGLFHVDALADLWRAFLGGRAPWEPVWSLVTVRAWMSARRDRVVTDGTEARRRAA
jgi:hypothetical protein